MRYQKLIPFGRGSNGTKPSFSKGRVHTHPCQVNQIILEQAGLVFISTNSSVTRTDTVRTWLNQLGNHMSYQTATLLHYVLINRLNSNL